MVWKIHNESKRCENGKLCDLKHALGCLGISHGRRNRTSYFLRWPDSYVHSWPTCSPLTSTHINSHSCHFPPRFWTVESTPTSHRAVSQSQPSDHMLCAVSAAERCSYLLGERWLNDWHSGDLSGSRPLGCAAVLGQSVTPCCCVMRLVGCRHVIHGAQGCKIFSHL